MWPGGTRGNVSSGWHTLCMIQSVLGDPVMLLTQHDTGSGGWGSWWNIRSTNVGLLNPGHIPGTLLSPALLDGVHQANPLDLCVKATRASTTISAGITTTVDNMLILDSTHATYGGIWTIGSNQTAVTNWDLNSAVADEKALVSWVAKASAGFQTMSWTTTVGGEGATVAIAFRPAVSAIGCIVALLTMGVGGC